MRAFPKLRYPIATKGLSIEERAILLAYDMIFRMHNQIRNAEGFHRIVITNDNDNDDTFVNLANLGHIIEQNLCCGDMALRFEGYDNMDAASMADYFSDKVDRELNQMKNGDVK